MAKADPPEVKPEGKRCFLCSATSQQAVLLACEHQGQVKWVCVRCLPPLIHGAFQ